MQNDSRYQIHNEEETSSEALLHYNEDADLHPNQLSGDQNGQQSVYTSALEGAKANYLLTVTTIIKTVIGASILAIPYSISELGYVFGTIVFMVSASLTQYGSILLLKSKNLSRHSNYATILYQIWKSRLAKGLGSLLIFLNNIGLCIAELIILKQAFRKIFTDTITDKLTLDAFYTQEYFLVLVLAVLETPLTLVSKMEKLKFIGLMGVTFISIFMIFFTIFFITASYDSDPTRQPAGEMNMFPNDWFLAAAAVPNILLALSYQMNFFPIYKGMKNVTDAKMAKASLIGTLFCSGSYLLVGILGYSYVGNANVSANFLQSLHYDKMPRLFFFIINFSFLISVYFAFPIMFFSGRNNFIALAKLILIGKQPPKPAGWQGGDELEEISSYMKQEIRGERKKKARLHFIAYTIVIYLVVIGVTIGVQDIKPVFNIVGAVCSTSIAILLPCFFYFKLILLKKQPKTFQYYLGIIIFTVMTPYAIFSIIALYVHPS